MSHLPHQITQLVARVLLLATLSVTHAHAATLATNDLVAAFNQAARQRMLTERMLKAYCLLGLNNKNSNARAQLHQAIEEFEQQLAILDALTVDFPALSASLGDTVSHWRRLESQLNQSANRDSALDVMANGTQVHAAADQLVLEMAKLIAHPLSNTVNIAGRQRMLTQKLLKTYMLLAWGFDTPQVHDEFIAAWNEFELALATLTASAQNTPQLQLQLELANEQWLWTKSAIGLMHDDRFYPDIVDDAGEKVLAILERVTTLYDQLLKQETNS